MGNFTLTVQVKIVGIFAVLNTFQLINTPKYNKYAI